jgi:hypothetical protein
MTSRMAVVCAWWRNLEAEERLVLKLFALVVATMLAVILFVGCAVLPSAPPRPPATPPRQTLAIDVTDEQGRAIVARVVMDERPTPLDRTTDGNGHVEFNLVPGPRGFSVTADGYDPLRREGVDNGLIDNGATTRHLTVALHASHVSPSVFTEAQLRNVQTDIAGVYLDEIKPQCPEDPVTHIRCVSDIGVPRGVADGILFTANYRLYTAAQRKVIRDVFTGKRADSRGLWHHFTHLALSLFCRDVPDYHGVYPPCTTHAQVSLNDALHELLDDHLIPIGFVMHDDEPDDLATPLSVAGAVDPSLVPLVTPYWEHYEVDCAMQKVRALFPTALLYYHNPTNTDAGYPDACYAHGSDAEYGALGGGRGWWRALQRRLPRHRRVGAERAGHGRRRSARLADFVIAVSASAITAGRRASTRCGSRIRTRCSSTSGNGGDAAANERRADQVLVQPICGEAGLCGTLAGYASGSSK